ncbi:hypothetical protein MMC28_004905 [Mycoblastus sanguinarius]|nr:hypothetical protein [Mycoblastus sanguinarius]
MSRNTEPLRLTAENLSALAEPAKPQMRDWLKKAQTHEQVAVGEKTSRSKSKMKKFLNKIEQKVEGDGK